MNYVNIRFNKNNKKKRLKEVPRKMEKNEQQTSRLEKISNFFGGSNFTKLNNYLIFL